MVVVDVVLRATTQAGDESLEAEILESCRASMAWHKVPARVRIVPSLPVGAAGKLLRPAA